jgi:hypothetical protein
VSPADTQQIAGALAKLPDVEKVTPVTTQNGISLIKLIPKSGPGDPATAALVHTIRDDRAAIEGQTGAHILVGGTTASNIDVSAKLSAALPAAGRMPRSPSGPAGADPARMASLVRRCAGRRSGPRRRPG